MNTAPALFNHPPGDGEAPPPGPSAAPRNQNHNLPDSLTTFIGREAERSALIDLLRRQHVRLVTLTGPGGIGKTRLATEVAREVAPAFRDGVRFVPVESIADPELAKLSLAQAIGLPRSVQDVETAVIEVLAAQHTLLLVDNFEQIVASAPFFARLLVAGPDVKMLITSRIPLRVSGEYVFETQPLSLPSGVAEGVPEREVQSEAVRLFIARARAANPQLSLDTASLTAMSRICERLDGFPLAIELAAARSNLLKPEAVLQRLDHRLALLTSGARDQPRRLQSLREAIGWSYDLLDAGEQRLFRTLCVFAGGFSLEALDAVAGPELPQSADVLEVLSVLIDSSLVRRSASTAQQNRYAVYETIREFGLDMLRQHGELDAVQDRHAAYFVGLAEQIFDLTMHTEPALLDRLDDEQSNFREALSGLLDRHEWNLALMLAGNLTWYWFQRGRVLEGRRWLHRAVGEAPGNVDPNCRCLAVFGLGLLAQASGNVAAAKELFEEAAQLARETGDDLQLAIATGLLAGALTTLGDFDRAAWLFAENELRWDARRKPTWMGHAYFHLGLIALGRNEAGEAARQFAASVTAYDEGNSPLYAVDALQYLGLVELMADSVREAARAFEDALNRLELRKSAPDLAMGIANVAALAARIHRPAESVAMFAAANAARDTAGLALPEPAASMYEPFRGNAIAALSAAAASDAMLSGEQMSLETALEIARTVLSGGDVVLSEMQEQADQFGLTEREFDVLRLLGGGRTNDEIARALFISNGTARTHVANILGKLGAHTRTEAAGIARRHGLI